MKALSLSFALLLCLFTTHAQTTHHVEKQETSATKKHAPKKKLTRAYIKKKSAAAGKHAETAQKGVNKLQEISGGRLKKRLGLLSKGLSSLMKTNKDVAKLNDDEKGASK